MGDAQGPIGSTDTVKSGSKWQHTAVCITNEEQGLFKLVSFGTIEYRTQSTDISRTAKKSEDDERFVFLLKS